MHALGFGSLACRRRCLDCLCRHAELCAPSDLQLPYPPAFPLPLPPAYPLQHRSPLHGWGMFAGQAIPRDAFIIEYTGEVVPHAVAGESLGRFLGGNMFTAHSNLHRVCIHHRAYGRGGAALGGR